MSHNLWLFPRSTKTYVFDTSAVNLNTYNLLHRRFIGYTNYVMCILNVYTVKIIFIILYILLKRPNAQMSQKPGFKEDGFFRALALFEPHRIELKADNCTKVSRPIVKTNSVRCLYFVRFSISVFLIILIHNPRRTRCDTPKAYIMFWNH